MQNAIPAHWKRKRHSLDTFESDTRYEEIKKRINVNYTRRKNRDERLAVIFLRAAKFCREYADVAVLNWWKRRYKNDGKIATFSLAHIPSPTVDWVHVQKRRRKKSARWIRNCVPAVPGRAHITTKYIIYMNYIILRTKLLFHLALVEQRTKQYNIVHTSITSYITLNGW